MVAAARWQQVPLGEPRLAEGARLFNDGRFFESHEVWESLWHEVAGPQRELLQGLIQAAAAYHHADRGNASGARYLAQRARTHLVRWRPTLAGVPVDRMLEQLGGLLDRLDRGEPAGRPSIQLHD
jgi:predicted metal-dependent hydrolase